MQVDKLTSPAPKRQAGWKLALNIALPVVLIAVFAWQIAENWTAIRNYHWSPNWELVIFALLLLFANSYMEVQIWNRTLGWFTERLPFRKVTPVYIWSSLARYVPGKVFSLFLRVALTAELQVNVVPVLASSTVELALRTASGLLLFILVLIGWGIKAKGLMLVLPLVVIPLILVCAHPKIMLPVMNFALKKIKQPIIEKKLRYAEVLGIFLATVVRWMIYGLASAVLAVAIFPPAAQHLPVLIGTAAGSWAAGFIGMSPGGVGLAEWVQKEVLEGPLKFPDAICLILPFLFRLGTLLAEGAWALISVFLWRSK